MCIYCNCTHVYTKHTLAAVVTQCGDGSASVIALHVTTVEKFLAFLSYTSCNE